MPLARDPEDRRRVIVTESGAACETRYELVPGGAVEGRGWSVVRCELITGRTHQIRVHLAALGCPVVGDATYGEKDEAITRQALHAWRISLPHPVTRERIDLEAPLPMDIRALLPGGPEGSASTKTQRHPQRGS